MSTPVKSLPRPAGGPGAGTPPGMEAVCRMIEDAPTPPTLAQLARRVNLSPWQLQRRFKAALGVSPRAYGAALRDARVRAALARGVPVTQALFDGGFGALSRGYAAGPAALGMTPGRFRAGGAGEQIRWAVTGTSLGPVAVAATARGVCAVEFGASAPALEATLRARFARAQLLPADAAFEALVRGVVAAVDDPAHAPELPLDIRGTAFQCRVWAALRALPPGTTASYGELAARIGAPGAARAVGSACAANPLAVLVPCHRALPAHGGTGQYRWGRARKQRLLRRERRRSPRP